VEAASLELSAGDAGLLRLIAINIGRSRLYCRSPQLKAKASTDAGKSRMGVKLGTTNFTLPPTLSATEYFDADPSVTVQVKNSDGACWRLHDGADQEEHRRAVLRDRSVSSIGIAALPPASLPPAFPPRSFFPVSFAPRYLRI